MKSIPFLILTIPLLLGLSFAQDPENPKKPVPIVFDTDMTGDVDDALALAMLHTMADRGLCEILAITISKDNELAAPFIDAVNTFYGRPDIPIGIPTDAPHRDSKYLHLANEDRYPHDLGVSSEAEPAVELLKRVLGEAEDHSVAIIQVGLAINLAQLLESEGGSELIAQKVDHLSIMAGAFTTIHGNNRYLEANVRNHISSMQTLADQWPDSVRTIWSGFAIGDAAPFPRASIAHDLNYTEHHPIKEAYLEYCGPDHDRPTWDLTSVLYSVFPNRGYFGYSEKGRVTVEDDGFTKFKPARGPKHPASKTRDHYLKMTPVQAARVKEALVQFVVAPPVSLAVTTKTPEKLIFDTDMGNDVDDALALAVIHTLETRGACELLAVTSTKDHPMSAAYIDAVNTFYGRPDIPIGVVRNGVTPEEGRFNPLAVNYPHDLKSGADAPEAVALLRKTLAAQPDKSVSIAQVGFFTNLARLLDSQPDDYSPLDGKALVEKKVKQLVIMAGAFQTIQDDNVFEEYNVRKDVPSAQQFAENWTSPIVWSGFEIGIAAPYPWKSVMQDFEYAKPHIIKESYLAYVPVKPHDRPTWDLTAVLHAVYPKRGYFALSPPGTVTVADGGATFFQTAKDGRDRYLKMNERQIARVTEALVQLTSEPPRK